eukprot:scaffold1717_cov169-Amphora_coffeaeformis.AAC.1
MTCPIGRKFSSTSCSVERDRQNICRSRQAPTGSDSVAGKSKQPLLHQYYHIHSRRSMEEEARVCIPLKRPRLTQQQKGQLSHLQALVDSEGDIRVKPEVSIAAADNKKANEPVAAAAADGDGDAAAVVVQETSPTTETTATSSSSSSSSSSKPTIRTTAPDNVQARRQNLLQQIELVTQIRQRIQQSALTARQQPLNAGRRQMTARQAIYTARADVLRLYAVTEALENNLPPLPSYDHYVLHFDVSQHSSLTAAAAAAAAVQQPRGTASKPPPAPQRKSPK